MAVFLQKAPPRGWRKPGAKYLDRWRGPDDKFRYRYGRPITQQLAKRLALDERGAHRLFLIAKRHGLAIELYTNHVLPDRADPQEEFTPFPGAFIYRILGWPDGRLLEEKSLPRETVYKHLQRWWKQGYEVVSRDTLPVPLLTDEERLPPQGGLTQAVREGTHALINQPGEIAFAFSPEGAMRWKRAGGESTVFIREDDWPLMRGAVFLHNHPGDKSFSLDDVQTAVDLDMAEVRVVGRLSSGTPVMYVLTRPEGGWLQNLRGEAREVIAGVPDVGDVAGYYYLIAGEMHEAWQEKIDTGELDYEWAEDNFRHYVWQRVAREFGWQYERRELKLSDEATAVPPGNAARWLEFRRQQQAAVLGVRA